MLRAWPALERSQLLRAEPVRIEARSVLVATGAHERVTPFRGWTLLLMPSAAEKEEARGFHTLPPIFACLDLAMMEPFEKISSAEQKRLGRAGRMGMSHSIRLKPGIELPQRCLLADDVITTGSTIRGALACMPSGRCRIEILACACVPENRRRRDAGMP